MGSQEFLKTSYLDPPDEDDLDNNWSVSRQERTLWKVRAQEAREILNQGVRTVIPDPTVLTALSGHLDGEYPMNDVPVVALFLSSTLTDTAEERDILIQDVYPFLKQFARSVGVEFYQPAEMRWGIRKEVSDAHLTSTICLREVKKCQSISRGLSYVLLFGNKYGFRPLPPTIPQQELDILCQEMKNQGLSHALELTHKWYILDTNPIPPLYRLQPKSNVDTDTWWGIFKTLHGAFRQASHVLSPDRAQLYSLSVTHHETLEGIVDLKDKDEQCYVFFRDVQGLPYHISDESAKSYIDVTDTGIDLDAQSLLANLKTELISSCLSEGRYCETVVPWSPNGISSRTHSKYLKDFADQFCSVVFDNIVEVSLNSGFSVEDLYEETVQHIQFCRNKMKDVIVTKSVEAVIEQAVHYVNGDSCFPLVIHGKSGAGKTSLMACCAYEIYKKYIQDQKTRPSVRPNLVVRFLGTTSGSGSSRSLFNLLLPRILRLYPTEFIVEGVLEEIPTDYSQQIGFFHSLLRRIPPERPLILMLDSLDQLSDDDNGRRLAWLPLQDSLPGVKMILSTLPDEGGCLEIFSSNLPASMRIEVLPTTVHDGEAILDGWLARDHRTLTADQKQVILHGFEQCPNPLYLKVAFEQSQHWTSYTPPTAVPVLGTSTRTLIMSMFASLEHMLGKIFVSAALGFITVARSGLSNNEIEDILSCDDVVLDDVFEWWTPPIRRVPPLLWRRLHDDLEKYFVRRGADGGIPVVQFYHRQFWEACSARYLDSVELRKSRHSAIADYFQGVWAEKPKPYGPNGKYVAFRHVPAQPLTLNGSLAQANCVLNLRRLGEEV
eukprot:TRINITY_DN19605_c0_g1::TRINITY_DN19605_c0_g1_i1::g.24501::m.24501 TRINITY_DN19605_c0_g1::TRINITY_DN19605_c0_g1_i1::g.24501  ORF type:complete len:856 (-),score=142.68,sp/Q149M9/NWD1_HUMAN/29.95/4e-76,NACHT/PF05729.7/3.3e-05,AAA_16/PF13191.1/6.6e+03,AAA_16/PF13191.1/0.0032,AAA_22/PF13401.1/0.0028,DUF4062/PF13271.1/0.0092,Bac_DnaA/PF00308.13/0.06,Ubiquitin_3/PF14836.1/0.17,AAA_23/PF13476.1/0.15,AAA_19/PF13245.1/0.25 TRINITY_DN19605_c0_g1_i1:97-2592(-)